MIDFTLSPDALEFLARLDQFVEEVVLPVESDVSEADLHAAIGSVPSTVEREVLPALRREARKASVYAPQLSREYGGLGLPPTTLALAAEICGPHLLASYAINMMAPEEGTMDLLHRFGSDEQKRRWLKPLAAGEIRSAFGMTEPDAGSDPRRITSTALRIDGGNWLINAHKVFTSGAIGAAFCVVMANSDPEAAPGGAVSMFIVPIDADGFEVVRDLKTMGFSTLGGHPEVRLENVVVGPEAQLGKLGEGLSMAQARLGTGRMGHAMRWIGIAQKALDLAGQRALDRETFGQRLAQRQAAQWWLADAATQLYAARLMVLNTLWKVENGLDHRTEVSMVKTFVAEALGDIVDNMLQVFGGWGYTTDFPIERWYRDARAARLYDGPSEVHRMVVARATLKAVARSGTAKGICEMAGGPRDPQA